MLIDSGAESNIINIPTWKEIKTLHPKLTPLATSSKLATSQGSALVNYGKIVIIPSPHENNGAKQNFKENRLNKYFILLILSTISLAYHLYLNIYQQSTS